MKTYFRIKIRWSDLDANRHLANSAYVNFCSHARIEFLRKYGVSMVDMKKWDIGPAILREEISYFKEARDGDDVVISVAMTGVSEKGEMYEFEHDLYLERDGTHIAHARILGVWMSMSKRRIADIPDEMRGRLRDMTSMDHLRTLSMRDLKELADKPMNIDPTLWKDLIHAK